MRTSTITQDDAVADTVPGTVSGVADAPPSASPDPGEHRDPGAERGATGGRRSRSGPIKGGAVLLAVSAGTAAVSAALPAAGGELTTDARTVLSVFTAALLCLSLIHI